MRPRDEPERAWAAEAIADGVRGAEPGDIPRRLCHVAVRLLPVARASVSLCNEGLPVPLSASDDRAAYLMEVQATLGEGPCLHAARTGAPVIAADLTAGRDAGRWPVFAQQATALGVRAVYVLPLGDAAGCLGTLDLYRDTPGALTPGELRTAYLMAGVMTVALMALPTGEEHGGHPRRPSGSANWPPSTTRSTRPSAWSWPSWASARTRRWRGCAGTPSRAA
ncbi:hypothetical protein GCM10020295_40320 [Streptomyces cinereospinus]